MGTSKLLILSAAFLMFFYNFAFFGNVIEVYSFNLKNSLFLLSLVLIFGCLAVFLFSLVCFKYTLKPILIFVFLISSAASYFMDDYNIIIDEQMIDNIVNTDIAESADLINIKFIFYIIVLGFIPSIFIYKVNIKFHSFGQELFLRLKLIAASTLIFFLLILIFGDFYASFFREHKKLRLYANPTYYIYATGKYINSHFTTASQPLKKIGEDAKISDSDDSKELVIFVVGETARSDRFSLNGYKKETNPYLKNEDVLSFSDFWACGTSTAVSVPCIFSVYGRADFDNATARSTENVLDILNRANVNVLWLDNNSDSKGVALRVSYESYKNKEINPLCDIECRDEGMLERLQDYIDSHATGDIFIVLHQFGNHGPAYYKRYPAMFEKFLPTCKTNRLESCSEEEINNSYDNAILYTDYFLSKVIKLLKKNSPEFEAAMFYVSDHGESLGESGIYLHGLPYFIAPDEQKMVPMILWFSDNFDKDEVDVTLLRQKIHQRYSHDNIFHTILGLMEVETSVYNKDMDLITRND